MDARIWQLPGPRSFVDEITLGNGRHVVATLPRRLSDDEIFADELAHAVLDRFRGTGRDARRISPDPTQSVLAAVSDLCWEPVPTVPDLLASSELADMVLVLAAVDLSEAARRDLPHLLERIECESRALPRDARPTFVVIGSRFDLPSFLGGARSEVGLESVWFWGRISRWDVAAHVASAQRREDTGLLAEVRLETIVEVAAWDIDTADYLVTHWCGDPDRLSTVLRDAQAGDPVDHADLPSERIDDVPPAMALAAWDARAVDSWQQRLHCGPAAVLRAEDDLARVVWAAQARVLLPWIEQRRDRLQTLVRNALGERFTSAMSRTLPDLTPGAPIEIGPLTHLIHYERSLSTLLGPATQLKRARNALAHLTPLSISEQRALVERCEELS